MRSLGRFHVGAIVNSAAMNTGVHVSFGIMVFSRKNKIKKRDEVIKKVFHSKWGFLGGSAAKNPPANTGDIGVMSSIPG